MNELTDEELSTGISGKAPSFRQRNKVIQLLWLSV